MTLRGAAFVCGEDVVELELIKTLIRAAAGGSILELSYSDGPVSLRIVRQAEAGSPVTDDGPAPLPARNAPAAEARAATLAGPTAGTPVEAPLSGTLYLSPSPGAPPFVGVGDRVAAGQTLALIEAMKMLTEVAAGAEGTVASIVGGDGEAVEAGAALFEIAR